MNREIKNYQAKQTVEVLSELDIVEIEADLYLFNRTVSSKQNLSNTNSEFKPSRTDAPSSRKVGVVNAKGKAELMAGKLPSQKNTRKLVWLTGERIEQMRTWGFYNVLEKLAEDAKNDKTLDNVWDQFLANPQRNLDELVELDYSSHMVNDRHGNPLPVGLIFDYINSHVDETRYDLPKLCDHMLSRDDVFVFRGDERPNSDPATWKQARTFEEALFSIPYYNAEDGRTQSIQFVWQPKLEDYRRVFASKNDLGRYWKVLESDVLDIKQFRKA